MSSHTHASATRGRRSVASRAALALGVALSTGCRDDAVHDTVADRAAASATPAASGGLALHPCMIGGGMARCGTYEVFENRATRSGRRIALVVVVLPAHGSAARRRPDPIFLLTGGPGIGVATEAWTARRLGAAGETRDIVLVDQRGTGGSAPLDCDLYGDDPRAFLGDRFPPAAVRACRAALAPRADLTQYTTPVAADDLDDVREALGYDRINLVGLSYGTRLALVYLRRHPDHARSAVLDGVVTTSYPTPLPAAGAGDRALARLFADCAADAACHDAYPDVAGDYAAALARLDRARAEVTLSRALGLTRLHATLDRRAFVDGVWRRLYAAGRATTLPRVLHRAAGGDFTDFAREIAAENADAWRRNSAGALLSIVCAEDVPYITRRDADSAAAASLVGAPWTRELIAACAEWPRAPLPADFRAPVRSSVPVLLLSGELDPISPPEWAAEAAGTLANALHVVHAFAGHVDDDACTRALAVVFLDHPDPRLLDSSCAGVTRRPPFRLD